MTAIASFDIARPAMSRARSVGIVLGLLLLASILSNLRFGAVPLNNADMLAALGLADGDDGAVMVMREIRLPRLLAAIAVGASLALAGCALQALFRNPLAEPGLLGVSTGAALGASVWFLFGAAILAPFASPASLAPFMLPLLSFLGALLAVGLVLGLGRRSGPAATILMLLMGIGVNAMGGALIGLATYMSTDTQLRALSVWLLGSFAQTEWAVLLPSLALMAAASIGLLRTHRALDLMALGEAPARHLGIDTDLLRRNLGLLTAIAVGASVALAGIIGFVGLLVPHMVRLAVGPGHRTLLPLSALAGAVALSVADLVARLVALPAEVPVGVVMALVGAPAFIWMLLANWRRLT